MIIIIKMIILMSPGLGFSYPHGMQVLMNTVISLQTYTVNKIIISV